MGLFQLLIGLCQDLERLTARFWWGGDDETRTIHWRSWPRLCRPKSVGGLGFRDLVAFNQAMVAKQSWRLLTRPFSLAARLLKHKYFETTSFLNAEAKSSASFLWRSLLWGSEVIKKGYRWRIGDGKNVKIFSDPWLPRPSSFRMITKPGETNLNTIVDSLFANDNMGWNVQKVRSSCWAVDGDSILSIPCGFAKHPDEIIWHYDRSGIYTVKSGYHLICDNSLKGMASASSSSPTSLFWNSIWSLNVPPKVRVFLWRLVNECLPNFHNLSKRGVKCPSYCRFCGATETTRHVLFECSMVRKLWRITTLSGSIDSGRNLDLRDRFERTWWSSSKSEREVSGATCFLIWKERNRAVHPASQPSYLSLSASASCWVSEFQRAKRGSSNRPELSTKKEKKWQPSEMGKVKLNVDATIFSEGAGTGFGGVVRGCDGKVLGAFSSKIINPYSPFIAECVAIREGLRFARDFGLHVDYIESDCLQAVYAVNKDPPKEVEMIVDEVRHLVSELGYGSCGFVPREGNVAAHTLARALTSFISDFCWLDECPCISDVIFADFSAD